MKRFVLILLSIFTCAIATAATETTEWWVNGSVYATTSCETGGDISTPPQNPTKKGYTFQGWETAVYDMSTLDATINGSTYGYNVSTKKWNATFSYGIVYGESLCSSTPSDVYAQYGELEITTDSCQYCYCRATEFKPNETVKIYEIVDSPWVVVNPCSGGNNCPQHCGCNGMANVSTRRKMYGIN